MSLPCDQIKGISPTEVDTIGSPQAAASNNATPKLSYEVVFKYTS